MKKTIFCLIAILIVNTFFAQEVLKSTEEDYYDFLSLLGITIRPTLGYRTLSDSEWIFSEESYDDDINKEKKHPWQNNNLGNRITLWKAESKTDNWFTHGIKKSAELKILSPEWFNSYNTNSPYGQNDGSLWQGRGYNTKLTAGTYFSALGFELTLRPEICFSENKNYSYPTPAYTEPEYAGKASEYGYYGIKCIDLPQRFGDSSFWTFDWGDTEVRWNWYSFTVGFGTQSPWLGPANLNPIIHSNNAASYPKFDIGMKRTNIRFPYFNWDLGDLEFRCWWGKLAESDYFDNINENDERLITGFSFYYQLPFLKELTVGMNRTQLSFWDNINSYTMFKIFVPGLLSYSGGSDESDQRISFTIDYKLSKVGFETYLEWAKNDYSPGLAYYIRYPFHTEAWTFGAKQAIHLPKQFALQLLCELTFIETSQDYELIPWDTTFYCHHIIKQGYTNYGQCLGAGIGTGGNSQYFGVKLYHKNGYSTVFIQRRNPDLDYTFFIDKDNNEKSQQSIRAFLDFGLENIFFIKNNLQLQADIIFRDEFNPTNKSGENGGSLKNCNFHIATGVKYHF